jgi:guanine deaminase
LKKGQVSAKPKRHAGLRRLKAKKSTQSRLQAQRLMNLAIDQGYLGMRNNHGGPFGAVVARNGRLVAAAYNEVIRTKDPTAHAEIVAIRRASAKRKSFDLSDCEVYSTCEPCPMCLGAIYWAGIRQVWFGCSRQDAARIGFRDKLIYDLLGGTRGRSLRKIRVGRRECLKLFLEWEHKDDRTMY